MKLRVYNLRWLPHTPEQHDLCAHGAVEVEIGGELLENDAEADWCVSAGALFLLRTLTQNHTAASSVGDQLIPCCGHEMYAVTGAEDVEIHTCNSGVNWEVRHDEQGILLRTANGAEEHLSADEWQQAVFRFADAVAALYARSLPKASPYHHEMKGYAAWEAEWSRRRGRPFPG